MKIINVAKDFSRFPGGRFRQDGDFSGERFRDDFLIPYLDSNETILIKLDGTRGYGSSFLEEVFGGLIRKGFSKEQLFHLIKLESSDVSLLDEIKEYINSK